jgi:hypothetical protein
MNKMIIFLFTLLFVMFFSSCSEEEVNKTDPPQPVLIVAKSSDTSVVEKGIDALFSSESPDQNYIFLEWYRNPETKLKGYDIYRSITPDRNFQSIARITTRNILGIDTSFIDKTVSLNLSYYYFVRAFDDLEQYGDPSDTVNYALIENPVLSYPVLNISTTSPVFQWSFASSTFPHRFVFRLERRENELWNDVHTKLCERITDYNPEQEWDLPKLQYDTTLSLGTYRWRIDSIGNELDQEGSESVWFIFNVQ